MVEGGGRVSLDMGGGGGLDGERGENEDGTSRGEGEMGNRKWGDGRTYVLHLVGEFFEADLADVAQGAEDG